MINKIIISVFMLLIAAPLKSQESFYDYGTSGIAVGYGYSELDTKYEENSKGVGILEVLDGEYAFGINFSEVRVVDEEDINDYASTPYNKFNSFTVYFSRIIRDDNNSRKLPVPIVAAIAYNLTNSINTFMFGASFFTNIEVGNSHLVPEVSGAYVISTAKDVNNNFRAQDDFNIGLNLGIGFAIFKSKQIIYITPGITFSKDQTVYGLSAGFAFNYPKSQNK